MQYAVFDNTKFPNVEVKLHDLNLEDHHVSKFIMDWNAYDLRKCPYTLCFDTSEVSKIPKMQHALSMAAYINKRKKAHTQYLTFSILYTPNKSVRSIFRIIFNLSTPMSPVFIFKDANQLDSFAHTINEDSIKEKSYIANMQQQGIIVFMPACWWT